MNPIFLKDWQPERRQINHKLNKIMIKAQLINLGRNNVNKVVEVKNTQALHREVGKHLLSRDWGMEETEDIDTYCVTVGLRVVGHVKILTQ